MRFILEIWPDIETDDPVELLEYAVERAQNNRSLLWDIEDDAGQHYATVSLDGDSGDDQ